MISVAGRASPTRALGFTAVLLYCSLAVVAFVFVVAPALRGELAVTAWADTQVYIDLARAHLGWELLTLSGNYVGPVALILAFQYDNALLLAFNCLLLAGTYAYVVRVYPLREGFFALLLLANPMLFASLVSVNKEILGLAGILVFACFLETRRLAVLFVAILLSMLARWHQVLAVILFLFLESRLWPLRRRPLATLVVVVAAVSVAYSLVPAEALASLGSTDLTAIQEAKAGGLLATLNSLQRHFGYAIAVLPKMALNWFGNLGRTWDLVEPGPDFDPTVLYNYAVIGHQLCMVGVTAYLAFRGRLGPSRPIVRLALVYSILFSLSLIIQYRYFFPVYGLLCLEASRRFRLDPAKAPGSPDAPAAGEMP